MTDKPPPLRTELTLYHGTIATSAEVILRDGVNLSACNAEADFGRGFYMTTSPSQALEWAIERATRRRRRRPAKPAVLQASVGITALADLHMRAFVGRCPNDADGLWEFVRWHRWHGRTDPDRRPNMQFDMVIGPVTSPRQSDPEHRIDRGLWLDYDQISFHTADALRLINGHLKLV